VASTRTSCRRRHVRFRVPIDREATVEFQHRGRGGKLPLYDIGGSGLSFLGLPCELPAVEEGTRIRAASIRIGDCTIGGELVIMHVTQRDDSRLLCGALFYPASDTDLRMLKSLIAGMQAASSS
jgi:hypothetical protein